MKFSHEPTLIFNFSARSSLDGCSFDLLQPAFPDGMNAWHRLIRHGQTPTAAEVSSANIHSYAGIAVLLLALTRLVVRWRKGVPAKPYTSIFLMPVSGIAAYAAGSIHAGLMKVVRWGGGRGPCPRGTCPALLSPDRCITSDDSRLNL